MPYTYVIIGLHGADVKTVKENVARVRMFLDQRLIDEDFLLPELAPALPKTQDVYEVFLKPQIEARMQELAAGSPIRGDGLEHPPKEGGHPRPEREVR
jgi:hypothetical protein